MSYATARELDLVDAKIHKITCNEIAQQYPSVFQNIGKLKDFEAKLHIDLSWQLLNLRTKFHSTCNRKFQLNSKSLKNKGLSKRSMKPTPWISPFVVIPKNRSEICLCVDMHICQTLRQSAEKDT